MIDINKDKFELPRFPINEKYGDLNRFEFLSKLLPLQYKNIYPIAFGKASISMMSGFLDYLTKDFPDIPIKGKPIVVSNTTDEKIEYDVDLLFSSHPVPNEKSILAGNSIINYISSSTEDDLVISNWAYQSKYVTE